MTTNEPKTLKWDSNNGFRAVFAQLKSGRKVVFLFLTGDELADDATVFGSEQHLWVLLDNSNIELDLGPTTIGVPFCNGWQDYPDMTSLAEGFIELANWRDATEVFGPEAMRALTEFYDSERRHRGVKLSIPAIT